MNSNNTHSNNTHSNDLALPEGVADEVSHDDLESLATNGVDDGVTDISISRLVTGTLIRCANPIHDRQRRPRSMLVSALLPWATIVNMAEDRGWMYRDGNWHCPDCVMTEILDGPATPTEA